MTKNPEHIAWDSHWAHLQRAEAPRSRLIPILIKSAYSVCSPAASRRGLGPVLPSRKSGDRPPQDCPACPPGLAGGTATYLGTFRPTVLVSPAGRCSGVTRRAVHPSKRLKARQRYPHGGLGASARLSTRGLNRGNRAGQLGRQSRPSAWSWTTRRLRYSFSARPKYGTCKEKSMKRAPRPPPHTPVLGDFLSCSRSH